MAALDAILPQDEEEFATVAYWDKFYALRDDKPFGTVSKIEPRAVGPLIYTLARGSPVHWIQADNVCRSRTLVERLAGGGQSRVGSPERTVLRGGGGSEHVRPLVSACEGGVHRR